MDRDLVDGFINELFIDIPKRDFGYLLFFESISMALYCKAITIEQYHWLCRAGRAIC